METRLEGIEALLAYCEEVESTQPAFEAMRTMSEVYADCEAANQLSRLDPFSAAYFEAAHRLYEVLADVRGYDPWVNERTPYVDLSRTIASPTPYQYEDSSTVGDFLVAWGWILLNMDVRSGAKVLEYGAGEGQLAIQLARMGCDVSVIDIDERYLEAVQAQCASLGIAIDTRQGQFGDGIGNKKFDRIIFFEAFHHAFNHAQVLAQVKPLLDEGGCIVFAGEPIVDPGYLPIPFGWGPRLDGISVRSTRKFGWCELGFQRPYFIERLMRSGYLAEHRPCPVTGRGHCFIARRMPMDQDIAMSGPFSVEVHGADSGWHPHEPTHRWTKHHAIVPLPPEATGFEAEVINYLPVERTVTLRSGLDSATQVLKPGERARMAVAVAGSRVEFRTDVQTPDIPDSRELGVAVEAMRVTTARYSSNRTA